VVCLQCLIIGVVVGLWRKIDYNLLKSAIYIYFGLSQPIYIDYTFENILNRWEISLRIQHVLIISSYRGCGGVID
jgi:hypothetical protein